MNADHLTASACTCSLCSTAAEPRLVGTGTGIPLTIAEARGIARHTAGGAWEVRSGSQHDGPFVSLADAAASGWVVGAS